ncbi:unnamed protein product [Pleuronectes platessa]|uniref:Uncharacterized protein n=1 Tax=Pleuronectes platessa TaxID=8262 RepID=A0A9N7UKK2_PLEPL|nr:unnamed protein product [Pleuronectes platessa]
MNRAELGRAEKDRSEEERGERRRGEIDAVQFPKLVLDLFWSQVLQQRRDGSNLFFHLHSSWTQPELHLFLKLLSHQINRLRFIRVNWSQFRLGLEPAARACPTVSGRVDTDTVNSAFHWDNVSSSTAQCRALLLEDHLSEAVTIRALNTSQQVPPSLPAPLFFHSHCGAVFLWSCSTS